MINYPVRLILFLLPGIFACHSPENENYPSHRYKLAEWPSSKLKPAMPLNSTGDILWANGLWNWGFTSNVQVIHHTNFNALPIKIESNGIPVNVKGGLYYPAYNLLEGETDSAKSNIACNPFQSGFPNPIASYVAPESSIWGPINGNHSPTDSWTYRGSPVQVNWYGVDLGEKKFVTGVVLEFSDTQYQTKCHLPENYFLEYEGGQEWKKLPGQQYYPEKATVGLNLITFPGILLQKIRVVFSPDTGGYSGLFRFQLQGEGSLLPLVIEKKMITHDDVLISLLEITNPSWHFPLTVKIQAGTAWATEMEKNSRAGKITFFDQELYLLARSPQLNEGGLTELNGQFELQPREKLMVRLALAIAKNEKSARNRMKTWLNKFQPLKSHQIEYDAWFQHNIPYFNCSDGWLTHLYYLRWQNVRRNYYSPECGFLQIPSFTAMRGEFPLFAATYFAGFSNLLQELRWLRHAHLGENAFRLFTDNMNANNQLPSVIFVNSIEYAETPEESLFKALYHFYLVQENRDFLKSQFRPMKKHFEASKLNLETDTLMLLARDMMQSDQSRKITTSTPDDPESAIRKMQNLFPAILTYYENCATIASVSEEIGDSPNASIYRELTRQIQNLIYSNFKSLIFQFSAENRDYSPSWLYPWYQISDCLPESTSQQLWQKFMNHLATTEMATIRLASEDSTVNLSQTQKIEDDLSGLNTFQLSNYLSFLIEILHKKPTTDIERNYFWNLLVRYATKQNQQFDSINIRINSEVLPEMSLRAPKNVETFAHTKFADFMITGIIGLVPSADKTKIVFDSLVPTNALEYFIMEKIPYHGHVFNVLWDKPGGEEHFNDQLEGFQIYMDGKLKASSRTLQRIEINFEE